MKNKIIAVIFLMPFCLFAQLRRHIDKDGDTTPYVLYKDKIVLYSDLGYMTAPFSIKYKFNPEINKIKYKNNFRTIIGFGVCYKWFALRLGIPLPGNVKSESKYGNTTPFNLGFDFTIKKTFCDIDFRNYKGYAIKNAKKWNDTLDDHHPNDIRKNTNSANFSINVWYFHDKNFKMTALRGKTGHYEGEVRTWYIKSSFNLFGVGNEDQSIIPIDLVDSNVTKTTAKTFSSVDLAIIPGYAYVNKVKNWQFSIIAGLGAALQSKFYATNELTRGFLGLAPRYDIKFIGGFTVPKYFIFLVTDFDNKSIRYTNLAYRQTFYSVKLVGGVRLDSKKDRKEKK